MGMRCRQAGSRGCAVHCRRSVRRRAQAPRKGGRIHARDLAGESPGQVWAGENPHDVAARRAGGIGPSRLLHPALLRQPARRALVKSSRKPVASSDLRPEVGGWRHRGFAGGPAHRRPHHGGLPRPVQSGGAVMVIDGGDPASWSSTHQGNARGGRLADGPRRQTPAAGADQQRGSRRRHPNCWSGRVMNPARIGPRRRAGPCAADPAVSATPLAALLGRSGRRLIPWW